jgi:hypothetical protein
VLAQHLDILRGRLAPWSAVLAETPHLREGRHGHPRDHDDPPGTREAAIE